MRPRTDLLKLLGPVKRRLEQVKQRADRLAASRFGREDELLVGATVIDTHNTWAEFGRAFFLSCALGARSGGGRKVTQALVRPTTPSAALAEAVYHMNKRVNRGANWRRRDEPNWAIRHTHIRLAMHFGFSNVNEIGAALSLQTRVFDDLPPVRNFYAHRNGATQQAAVGVARNYGVSATTPTQFVLGRGRGRPQTVLEDWADDLSFVVEYLCTS